MTTKTLSPKVRTLLKLSLFYFLCFFFMRLLFFVNYHPSEVNYSFSELLKALYLSSKFDLRITMILIIPFLFLLPTKLTYLSSKNSKKDIWTYFYTFIFSLILLFYFTDFGHYSYLQGHMNKNVLRFFSNPIISAQMVWESYPILWIFLTFIIATTIAHLILKKYIFSEHSHSTVPKNRQKLISLIIILIWIGALYGKFSFYPLRWSEAFFSTNKFISSMAINPIHYFFDSFANRSSYNIDAVRKHYPYVAKYLGVVEPDSEKLNFERPIAQTPILKENTNIILIVMESFAANKLGFFGGHEQTSKNFDQIAKNGLLFTKYYGPTESTARGIFSLLTGVPDVSVDKTASRNPLMVNHNIVINAFDNYEKFYFIGGSANWGNIRGFLTYNIPGIQIIEEGMFNSPRVDVWGISDLDLFKEANDILKTRTSKKPFFSVIQTAGFHRPYTIPEDKGNFKEVSLTKEELTKYGFLSNEEYNSLRFSDYSLGEFIRLAQGSKYFDNTLFVIVGDHGLSSLDSKLLPKGINAFDISRWHTPLLLYAPNQIQPKIIDKVATSPDVLPTLAGIAGKPFINTSLGRNLFASQFDNQRYAFQYVYYSNPIQIHLLDESFLVQVNGKNTKGLFKYQTQKPFQDFREVYPEKFIEMNELVRGLYETSRYILYKNYNVLRNENSH